MFLLFYLSPQHWWWNMTTLFLFSLHLSWSYSNFVYRSFSQSFFFETKYEPRSENIIINFKSDIEWYLHHLQRKSSRAAVLSLNNAVQINPSIHFPPFIWLRSRGRQSHQSGPVLPKYTADIFFQTFSSHSHLMSEQYFKTTKMFFGFFCQFCHSLLAVIFNCNIFQQCVSDIRVYL